MLTPGSFAAMGCVNTVVVPEADALPEALGVASAVIADVDRACSRFREDSEISRINAAGGGTFALSPLLEDALRAALRSAEITGGRVDLTLGARLRELGYTVTFGDLPRSGPPLQLRAWETLDWRSLGYDAGRHTLEVPAGVELDLGASGKAWAADRAAAAVAAAVGLPACVSCGGDVAVAGPPLPGGWPVRVEPEPGSRDWQDVLVFTGGLATSGVNARRWRRGLRELHHIIDPADGLPARTPWTMVTVAGATCVDANAAATAAVIMGRSAPAWLEAHALPARLVDQVGGVRSVGGWPA